MKLPNHVGLIIDGNRRWARNRGLNPLKGHVSGFKLLKNILRFIVKTGIPHISVYALSIKNLKRSEKEVKHLFKLLEKGIKDFGNDKELTDVRIKVLGRTQLLPKKLQDAIKGVEEKTKHKTKHVINLCIAYDGHSEIVDAVKSIINSGIKEVDDGVIKNHLYTRDSPELDLIIRTGMSDGARISGFLVWDASYAEFIFREDNWPDYSGEKFMQDLEEFDRRNRRFGK